MTALSLADPLVVESKSPVGPIRFLRRWGTNETHALPSLWDKEGSFIGTAPDSWLRIEEPAARRHAELVYRKGVGWYIVALGTHSIWQDGERRRACLLARGTEITIGPETFVAESQWTAERYRVFRRLLGCGAAAQPSIEHALRSVRLAATRRALVVIRAAADVDLIAQELHECALGRDAPFVMCNPGCRPLTRIPQKQLDRLSRADSGLSATLAAENGTVCFYSWKLPDDFDGVIANIEHRAVRPLVLIGVRVPGSRRLDSLLTGLQRYSVCTILIPPLSSRSSELPEIVQSYAEEAMWHLRTTDSAFSEVDRQWIVEHAARSLLEIREATLRLVALHVAAAARNGTLHRTATMQDAANMLGVHYTTVDHWIRRFKPPMR
jgi:hypothetical protein